MVREATAASLLWRTERAQEIALFVAQRRFAPDVEERGKDDPLDQGSGVVVHRVRRPGIALGVGRRQVLDLQ